MKIKIQAAQILAACLCKNEWRYCTKIRGNCNVNRLFPCSGVALVQMFAALCQNGTVAVGFGRGNDAVCFHLVNQAGGAVVADA